MNSCRFSTEVTKLLINLFFSSLSLNFGSFEWQRLIKIVEYSFRFSFVVFRLEFQLLLNCPRKLWNVRTVEDINNFFVLQK